MVYVYAIAYYCAEYILNSIHSLRKNTREEFNLAVCEHLCPDYHVIGQLIRREVESD